MSRFEEKTKFGMQVALALKHVEHLRAHSISQRCGRGSASNAKGGIYLGMKRHLWWKAKKGWWIISKAYLSGWWGGI